MVALGTKWMGLIVLASGLCASTGFAQESDSSSNVKIKDVDGSSINKVPGEDADDILTNNKLRAESGSKSRFSIASTMAYNGATVNRPFSDYRPNIQATNGQTSASDIEGGLNIKYNITQRDSLLLGETIRFITPLSSLSQTPNGYHGQKTDSYNPSLNYQRIYKLGGLQSYYQVGPTIYTQTDYTSIGYLGNFGIYNVNAYDIGKSHFTVGLESGANYNWFRAPQAYPEFQMSVDDTKSQSSDYVLMAYPYLEYSINDRINIRTVCMWFQIEHTLARPDLSVWHKDTALQSVGVGISVTRDIFLYPNVQFIPDQTRASQTNLALSTNINLF